MSHTITIPEAMKISGPRAACYLEDPDPNLPKSVGQHSTAGIEHEGDLLLPIVGNGLNQLHIEHW